MARYFEPTVLYIIILVSALFNFSEKVEGKCLSFPKHFDVRFAEHTGNLLNAVLHNLDAARRVWCDMVDGKIEAEDKEKQMARGFLKKWYEGSKQVYPTICEGG